MQLNSDFAQKICIHDRDNQWRASPSAGVERKMLDRVGDEVARATTIVRFAPGSAFAPHTHDGGEEYIVLDGVFQDESGDFPVGTYVRNPPTSRHTPSSAPGATIFVKLWQFTPEDRKHVRIDMNTVDLVPDPKRDGVETFALFKDAQEQVVVEAWNKTTAHPFQAPDGAEILVLEGSLIEDGQTLQARDWLRLPPDSATILTAGPTGARIWVKTGHLRQMVEA
ncbi:cupin domain-containing protein [Tateyamaria pelophila]|uniref:cupin domain-containing protein n=1 Tax=Tateyamaria pelophila TaxID=328415 RepID=UPI001CC1619C|nr:cupin domain-containing protein [Tateyamaria pelophila]